MSWKQMKCRFLHKKHWRWRVFKGPANHACEKCGETMFIPWNWRRPEGVFRFCSGEFFTKEELFSWLPEIFSVRMRDFAEEIGIEEYVRKGNSKAVSSEIENVLSNPLFGDPE